MGSRSLNKVMIIGNVGGEPRVASTRKIEIVASEMIAFNKREDARASPPPMRQVKILSILQRTKE